MLKKILTRLKIKLSRMVGPVMIYGFRSCDGCIMKKTRYGSTTYFQGIERIKMGDNAYIAHYCFIDGSNGLDIGDGCQICSFTSILTHSSHISIRLYGAHYSGRNMKGYTRGSTVIGSYSFIGPHATLMPGTTIGKGSIVAAYSYVEGAFPNFAIIAGNPATVVGDTRKMDQSYLEENPDLQDFYDEWALE